MSLSTLRPGSGPHRQNNIVATRRHTRDLCITLSNDTRYLFPIIRPQSTIEIPISHTNGNVRRAMSVNILNPSKTDSEFYTNISNLATTPHMSYKVINSQSIKRD